MREKLTTNHKSLKINLDSNFYGTFAEIGAGQEVARNFFKVGGASGTVAKAMSAYDMIFSNAIYGDEEGGRYVSKSRLSKMLSHEWELLVERLQGEKYEGKKYFVFANTVTTINYNKTNESHGWLGVRFQTDHKGDFNDVILHVKLLDTDSSIQQSVLGDLGVNLIYSCYQYHTDPNLFLDSLMDNLPKNSVEIDMVSMNGKAFEQVDNRMLSLILVTKGFSKAACFMPDGNVAQPKDLMYKKNVCILRARFKPVTNLNIDMLEHGVEIFKKENEFKDEEVITLCEITLNNLSLKENEIDIQDFIDRADILCKLGYPVLVTNFPEHFELTRFIKTCKPQKMGIILGVMNLIQILDTSRYTNLVSDLMLQFGNLFSQDIKLYAYPLIQNGGIINSKQISLPDGVKGLYEFIMSQNVIVDIENYNPDNLKINSTEIAEDIRQNREGWESKVPAKVIDLIKEKCLFDYPCDIDKRRRKVDENLFEVNVM